MIAVPACLGVDRTPCVGQASDTMLDIEHVHLEWSAVVPGIHDDSAHVPADHATMGSYCVDQYRWRLLHPVGLHGTRDEGVPHHRGSRHLQVDAYSKIRRMA